MKTTKPLEILIVDDEAAGRGILKKLLPDILNIPFSLKEADCVAHTLEIVKHQKIDLLFLDVQMPEQNGFDLLKKIPIINFEIIFVTGYDQYAVHAFRFNALDYLLKPVDVDELTQALNKAIIRIEQKQNKTTHVSELLNGFSKTNKKIAVHVNDKVFFIDAANISHIKASDNYSEITTTDKQKFTTTHLLKEFEFYLQEMPSFVRINRNVIVNGKNLLSYTKTFPCVVEMKCGCSFEISRRRKAEILKLLEAI